jgi:predicted transcriptional regulator
VLRFVTRKKRLPHPTEAELSILAVLWRRGPSTVRDVHDALERRQTGYTTVLKLMQIMAEKGLLVRDESERSHVYSPAEGAQRTRRRLVADFLDKVFAGSASDLVLNLLSSKRATRGELEKIRALLDEHDADASRKR